MPVPSQCHCGFPSFPVVDWFCLFADLWVLTLPLKDCSVFGNFVITLIYNYLCSQCISPLTLWVRIPLGRGVLDTTLCDKAFPNTPVSSANIADRHDITEILLKVALNTTTLSFMHQWYHFYISPLKATTLILSQL
jgi:hypothetical protein